MAKLQIPNILKNSKGQSVVEYILLLAVLSALGFSFFNNPRFKEFVSGRSGLFLTLRQGIEYSFRYGRAMDSDVDLDAAREFDHQTNKHDTYFDVKNNRSRFFTGTDPYGK